MNINQTYKTIGIIIVLLLNFILFQLQGVFSLTIQNLNYDLNQSEVNITYDSLNRVLTKNTSSTNAANNTQAIARFDKIATYGGQIWAFNYISDTETTSNFTYMVNITPTFYVFEMANLTNTTVINRVKAFINATRQ